MNILNTKYNISGTEKDKISIQLARYIIREHDGVVAAYLFGSFIGKDQFSDIDLKYDCLISAVYFSREELEDGPFDQSPVYKKAIPEGIRV